MGSCATPSWLRRDEEDMRSLAGELFSEIEKDTIAARENDTLVVDFNAAKPPPPRAPAKRQPKALQPPEVQVQWSASFVAIAEEFGIELDDEPLDERACSARAATPSTHRLEGNTAEADGSTGEAGGSGGTHAVVEVSANMELSANASALPAPESLSPQRGTSRSPESLPRTPEALKKGKRKEAPASSLSHADHFQKIMGVSVTALSRSPVLKVGGDRINALRSPSTPSRLQEFDLNATRASPVPQISPILQAREGLLHSNKASAEAVVPSEPMQPPEEISQFSQFTPSSGHSHQRHKRRRSHSAERGSQAAPRKRRRRIQAEPTPSAATPAVKDEVLSATLPELLESQFDSSGEVEATVSQLTPLKSCGSAPSQFVDSQGRIGRWQSSASELRMKAHSQRLKATRASTSKAPTTGDPQSDEELLNDALQLVAKLEGECRYKKRSLAKLEAHYRAQEAELRKLSKRRDSLKKKAVTLQRRILSSAAAANDR